MGVCDTLIGEALQGNGETTIRNNLLTVKVMEDYLDDEKAEGRHNGGKTAVLILDFAVSVLSSLLAILFVRWQTEPVAGFGHLVYMWVFIGAVFSLLSFMLFGTYKIIIRHSTLKSIGQLALATIVKELLLTACVLLGLFHFGTDRANALVIFADTLITITLLVVTRVIIMAIYDDVRDTPDKNVDRVPVMVYGASDKSVALVIRLEDSAHYIVQGYLTRDKSRNGLIAQDRRFYSFENEDDISHLAVSLGFRSVLFARDEDAEAEGKSGGLIPICMRLGIHCLATPRIDSISVNNISQSAINEVVRKDVEFIPDGMSSFGRIVKRLFDFVLSSLLLIIFSPLYLIIGLFIKSEDKGPAIYKQERIGRFGRPFFIYKFRSMRTDAESAGPALFSGEDDPRLTKVGKFIRLHHLDELPQLYNVWRGDMSFVGHRPERKFYIDQIMEHDSRYYYLYQLRPGVTSYSTLKNGYADSMEKMLRRLEFDLYYLRHRSWWFDVKVLWQTFAGIAFGKVF